MGRDEPHISKADGHSAQSANNPNQHEQLTPRSTRASNRRQHVSDAHHDRQVKSASASTAGSVGTHDLEDLDLNDASGESDQVASLTHHKSSDMVAKEDTSITVAFFHTEASCKPQDQAQLPDSVLPDKLSPHGGAGDDDHDPASEPATKKAKTTVKSDKELLPRRKSRSKWDNPLEMLTNQNSPLGKTQLRNLLCIPRAWDILSEDEKRQVLTEFPSEADILDAGTDHARPNIMSLRNNDNFRHDISRYQENLREGRHDPEWISQAQAAHKKRALGLYDEFLAKKFEDDWGMPMPVVGNDSEKSDSRSGSPPRNLVAGRDTKVDKAISSNHFDSASHPAPAEDIARYGESEKEAALTSDHSNQMQTE